MKDIFLILSIMLPMYSPVPYISSILNGETRPHRTTRFVYFIIGLLTTAALFSEGNTVAFSISAVSLFQAVILLMLSFRYGMGGYSHSDLFCLFTALLGVYAWQTTQNPLAGLVMGITADFAGTIPTIIKSYHKPESEEMTFYLLDTIAGCCSIAALPIISPESAAYPAYIAGINGIITVIIFLKRRS